MQLLVAYSFYDLYLLMKTRFSAVATKIASSTGVSAAIALLLLLGGCDAASMHPYKMASSSMLPLLRPGDRIFVDETSDALSDLHDGDVIAFRRKDAVVLKRILAMPGETISGDHRKISRDGKQLDEPYLAPQGSEDIPELTTFSPRKVPAGELFVMGDNRDISLDSRSSEYGPVLLSDVIGKYTWTYWHASEAAK
jgi:signal peptidase I